MKLTKTKASEYNYGIHIDHYSHAMWAVVDSNGNQVCEVLNSNIHGWQIIVTTDEGKKQTVADSETGMTWKHTTRKQVSDLALAWATNL